MLTDFLMPSFLEEFPLSESAWSECGPLHLRHYLRCENPTGKLHAIQTGKILRPCFVSCCSNKRKTVLMSSQFVSFLSNLSGTNLVFESWEIRKFERGKHYTLLHDHVEDGASVDSSTLDVCFTILDPPCSNDIDWEMSFGGFVSYVDSNPKDEDDDDKEGGDDALMTLFPLHNSLSVVVCEKGIVSFTKYLSASAPSNRIDFVAKFQLGDPIEQLQMEFSSMSESEQEEGEGEEEKPTKKLKY